MPLLTEVVLLQIMGASFRKD
jgi:hypothetical protein